MTTALIIALISGQFFSQACKQGGDCRLDDLTVSGTTTLNNLVVNDGGSFNGNITADNFIARDGGVFGGGGTFGADVTANNFIARDGGVFGVSITISATELAVLGACGASTIGKIKVAQGVSGGGHAFLCDGQFWAGFSTYSAGVFPYRTPVGRVVSTTIASGVITTGNNLLGAASLPYASSSGAGGNINVFDLIGASCAVAGTGAGTVSILFRQIIGTPGTVCTATYPCATAALTPAITSCEGNLTAPWADFTDNLFGTRLDVSGCTAPPADCVITHDVYTN